MQSNGGVMTPDARIERPVTMMESGPVGGIIASAEIGKALGYRNVVSFDMGGTTAKASLVRDGEPTMAQGYYVGGYASGHPVMVPVVDVVEVGAGGGSIAWIDEVGALKVGPQSAGADPGPICYRRGGTEPTITDANVVARPDRVRTISSAARCGSMPTARGPRHRGRASASRSSMDAVEAARAVIQIAIAKMSLAVREVSVEKGYDPRDFALVASGGAGPLHALAIARELHIPTVIVPRFPSHFSAFGMLMADERHDFIRTYYAELRRADFAELRVIDEEMVSEAARACGSAQEVALQILLDLRYVGQEFALSVPVTLAQLPRAIAAPSAPPSMRCTSSAMPITRPMSPSRSSMCASPRSARRPKLMLPALRASGAAPPREQRQVYFDDAAAPVECPVYRREELPAGARIAGPALDQRIRLDHRDLRRRHAPLPSAK